MNTTHSVAVTLLGICLVATVASVVLPETHMLNPMSYIHGTTSEFGMPDTILTENEDKVPLFVYVGTPVTARNWSSFYDRRHTGARSPLLEMCMMTHRAHHQIGRIIPIDDNDLMRVLREIASNDTIQAIAGDRGQVSLQHDRILRDALLFYLVCKEGGILIPHNAILLGSTGVIWEDVLKSPKESVLVYSEQGNNEYGCPVIATRGNTHTCQLVATTLFGAGANRELYGGIIFSGGSSVILDRLRSSGVSIHALRGICAIQTHSLVEMSPLTEEVRNASCVVIPFEQGSGKTSIPTRDKWIYSESSEGILKNPTMLRDLFIISYKRS